jgi:hypothetical protein
MSDFIPKPGGVKVGGLSRQAQKLQALRDKAEAANNKTASKPTPGAALSAAKPKSNFAGKKTSFQRKAV